MANNKIFCNIPWFELNINHDGSYDLCGCQNNKLLGTELGQVYNIKKIPIEDYWNSDRLKEARLRKLGDIPDTMCKMCQNKDAIGYASNRVKENYKSVIFNEAFDRSYMQSPNYHHFKYSEENNGATQSKIHSLHINLGSVCNFGCRMCNPFASTRLYTEFKQLGWLAKDDKFTHWTEHEQGWNNFVKFLEQQAENIKVVHVIGGEVGFMPKFSFLINYFIDAGLADQVNFSFTTNGSLDYTEYYKLLSFYKRGEIGISIESVDIMGDYIRQGGNIDKILKNISLMNDTVPSNTSLAIRTVPSLLSLPSYAKLISWAKDIGIPIDNSLLVSPPWQQAVLLPDNIKELIVTNVGAVLSSLPVAKNEFNNQKNANNINASIRNECESIIKLAQTPAPGNADELRKTCAEKLSQWDKMKGINIKDYSSDLYSFLSGYGYNA